MLHIINFLDADTHEKIKNTTRDNGGSLSDDDIHALGPFTPIGGSDNWTLIFRGLLAKEGSQIAVTSFGNDRFTNEYLINFLQLTREEIGRIWTCNLVDESKTIEDIEKIRKASGLEVHFFIDHGKNVTNARAAKYSSVELNEQQVEEFAKQSALILSRKTREKMETLLHKINDKLNLNEYPNVNATLRQILSSREFAEAANNASLPELKDRLNRLATYLTYMENVKKFIDVHALESLTTLKSPFPSAAAAPISPDVPPWRQRRENPTPAASSTQKPPEINEQFIENAAQKKRMRQLLLEKKPESPETSRHRKSKP